MQSSEIIKQNNKNNQMNNQSPSQIIDKSLVKFNTNSNLFLQTPRIHEFLTN